jgi:hypothetical protein
MALHRMNPLRIEAPACEMGGYIGAFADARNLPLRRTKFPLMH